MKNKRTASLLLVMVLILSTFSSVFAAELDLKNTQTNKEYSLLDWFEDPMVLLDLNDNPQNYVIEVGEKTYNLSEITEKMQADKDLTLEEAVKDLTPVDEKPVEDELKVVEISAINLRQIKVTFNKELNKASATNLANYYIGLVDETTGDVQLNSIKKLDNDTGSGAEEWEAKLQADKKTVIIQSKTGQLLTDDADSTVAAGGLGLKLNERYYLQVRNVKDADGNYGNAQEKDELLTDNVRPTVKLKKAQIEDNNLVLVFSEPITAGTSTIYVDGDAFTGTITDVTPKATALKDTVAAESKITVDISSLKKGTHKIAVVGTQDLNENIVTPNPTELTFTKVDATDVTLTEPIIVSMEQVADNGFKIVFNTTNVTPVDVDHDGDGGATAARVLDIKNAAHDGTNFVDLDVAATNIYTEEVDVDFDGVDDHTEWYVTVPADAGLGAGAGAELVYNGANTMRKDVVVYKDAYFNDGDATGTPASKDANEPAGKEKTVAVTFTKDTKAPVIANEAKDITHANAIISIAFTDGPFGTDVYNGEVELGTKDATIKFVDKNGVTHEDEVTPALGTATVDGRTVVDLTVTDTNMINNGKLVDGTYTITLPDGFVLDTEETIVGMAEDYLLVEGQNPFVKRTVTYTVEDKENIVGVPATTKGLINSKVDASTKVTDVQTDLDAILKANQIAVVFDGDVDPATAIVKANYKLNGKALGSNDTVEFRKIDFTTADINGDGTAGDTNVPVVVITLADGTVKYSGSYDFEVSGVANRLGNKMLAVSDTVELADNTAPVASSVSIEESNKVKVKFSETVNLDATYDAYNNFRVTVNGMTLSVIAIDGDATNELTLTLADNFVEAGESLDVAATVVVKLDSNGDMFVTDNAGNKLATGTVTK